MLGKLIKNEFKATGRIFFPVYILMVVVSICLKITMELSNGSGANNNLISALGLLFLFTFVLAIMAVTFGTVVIIMKRFYDNMLKDEGYLSFTLPVTVGQHLASKLIVSYVWVVTSAVVIFLSGAILPLGHGNIFAELYDAMKVGLKLAVQEGYLHIVIEMILLLIIAVYTNIVMGYTCFSVGQNLNKHRILGAFITYIAIYMITQIVNTIFMVVLLGANINQMDSVMSGFFQPYMIYLLIFSMAEAIIFTVVTHIMLSRKLNLE